MGLAYMHGGVTTDGTMQACVYVVVTRKLSPSSPVDSPSDAAGQVITPAYSSPIRSRLPLLYIPVYPIVL